MTLVKNISGHAYSPTVGPTLAPTEVGDVTLTYPQELDAVAIGVLLVLDGSYVPPTPAPEELDGGWRAPLEAAADLPMAGNDRGDVRLVAGEGVAYWWDGDSWVALAGGGGGGGPGAGDIIDITALLTGIADGDPVIWQASNNRFVPGELVPE